MSTVKDNFSTPIGGRLAEERERLGLTQAEAATLCGVSRAMWGRYERGKASMGVDVIARFAAAGADVAYILIGEKTLAQPLTPREAALLDNYRHSPEEAQRNLETMGALLAQRPDKNAKKTG